MVCLFFICPCLLSGQSFEPNKTPERWRFSVGLQSHFTRNAGEFVSYMNNQEREVETFSTAEASYNAETGMGWGGVFRAEFEPWPKWILGIGGGVKRVQLKEEFATIQDPTTANPILLANRIQQTAVYTYPQLWLGMKRSWGSFLLGLEANSYLNGNVARRTLFAGQGPRDFNMLQEVPSFSVPAQGSPSPNDPNEVIFSRKGNSEGMNPLQANALAELRIEPFQQDYGVYFSLGYALPLNGFRTSNDANWSLLGTDNSMTLEEQDLDSYLHVFSFGVGWTLR